MSLIPLRVVPLVGGLGLMLASGALVASHAPRPEADQSMIPISVTDANGTRHEVTPDVAAIEVDAAESSPAGAIQPSAAGGSAEIVGIAAPDTSAPPAPAGQAVGGVVIIGGAAASPAPAVVQAPPSQPPAPARAPAHKTSKGHGRHED